MLRTFPFGTPYPSRHRGRNEGVHPAISFLAVDWLPATLPGACCRSDGVVSTFLQMSASAVT
jgi:hypothetical protein